MEATKTKTIEELEAEATKTKTIEELEAEAIAMEPTKTIEELEAEATKTKTIEELKAEAIAMGINFHPNIGYKKLEQKIKKAQGVDITSVSDEVHTYSDIYEVENEYALSVFGNCHCSAYLNYMTKYEEYLKKKGV